MYNNLTHVKCIISQHNRPFFKCMLHSCLQWRTERGGLGCSNPPPQNSEDIGGVLDRMSKKNRRLDFHL